MRARSRRLSARLLATHEPARLMTVVGNPPSGAGGSARAAKAGGRVARRSRGTSGSRARAHLPSGAGLGSAGRSRAADDAVGVDPTVAVDILEGPGLPEPSWRGVERWHPCARHGPHRSTVSVDDGSRTAGGARPLTRQASIHPCPHRARRSRGLNCLDHAAESGLWLPAEMSPVFTRAGVPSAAAVPRPRAPPPPPRGPSRASSTPR